MRGGLTMIELIFVIIILGILAAVALPKLQSTRDDAKIATIAQQAQDGIAEILATYTAQGIVHAPAQMSKVLAQMVYTGNARSAAGAIPNSLGLLSIEAQDGIGGIDHPFIFDINSTELVFRHGTPCNGVICKTLQKRVAEGNYTLGSGVVF